MSAFYILTLFVWSKTISMNQKDTVQGRDKKK